MDNMYTGKSSRNPNKPLIWGIIIGIALMAFGIILYFDLAAWENSNEEKHLHSLIWGLYDLGGKLLVAITFVLIGCFSMGMGYKKSSDLKKIVKQASDN